MSSSRFDRFSGRLALAVSLLALVVAMGGTSFAVAKLAKNSVNSATIKNNTVTGADVKDRSLTSKDFKPGQLPAGAPGPQGPRGAPGAPGTPGDRGPAGPGAKAFTVSGNGPTTYQLADGVVLRWECDASNWHDGNGTTIAYGHLTLAAGRVSTFGPTTDSPFNMSAGLGQSDFTGTVSSTTSGAAVWLDAHILGEHQTNGCTNVGTVVYLPVSSQS